MAIKCFSILQLCIFSFHKFTPWLKQLKDLQWVLQSISQHVLKHSTWHVVIVHVHVFEKYFLLRFLAYEIVSGPDHCILLLLFYLLKLSGSSSCHRQQCEEMIFIRFYNCHIYVLFTIIIRITEYLYSICARVFEGGATTYSDWHL